MQQQGYIVQAFEHASPADVYVINTCSVTENADKECRQLVRRIQRQSSQAVVVITGCYAQLKPEEIVAIPGVDLVLGAAEKFNLAEHINNFTKGDSSKICSCDIEDVNTFVPTYSEGHRTRTFLKIQDGCNYNCSFCTIPLARGKSRSDSIGNIIQNIKAVALAGTQEVVLTGINLGDYNYSSNGGNSLKFTDVVEQIIDTDTGINRFRISSIEPNLLSNKIIDLVAQGNKFMPHLHIPLQSGSNTILGAMRRRYQRELYAERVAYIKQVMPHACIGVDVIVGFPGESETEFNETFEFLHELDISYLHVFTYSERSNTLASTMASSVPQQIRHQRNKILRNLSVQKLNYFTAQHKDSQRPVLWEHAQKQQLMEGYTDNYIKCSTLYNAHKAGTIELVTI
jgi:threonylcarbamoyladenosine tRNA methylthiotransferase MtaB